MFPLFLVAHYLNQTEIIDKVSFSRKVATFKTSLGWSFVLLECERWELEIAGIKSSLAVLFVC